MSAIQLVKQSLKDCFKHLKPLLSISIICRLALNAVIKLLNRQSVNNFWNWVLYAVQALFHSPHLPENPTTPSAISTLSAIAVFFIENALSPLFITLPILLILSRPENTPRTPLLPRWKQSAIPLVGFSVLAGMIATGMTFMQLLYRVLQTVAQITGYRSDEQLVNITGLFIICILLVLFPPLAFLSQIAPIVIVKEGRKTLPAIRRSYLLLAQNFFPNFWRFLKPTILIFAPIYLISLLTVNQPFDWILSAILFGVAQPLAIKVCLSLYKEFSAQRIVHLRPRLQKLAKKLKPS